MAKRKVKSKSLKKLDYAGIPEDVLNMVIGESYGLGEFTLKDEIDKYGQDLIFARYNVKNGIEWFQAWTDKLALIMVNDLFDDQILLGIDRNPPND